MKDIALDRLDIERIFIQTNENIIEYELKVSL